MKKYYYFVAVVIGLIVVMNLLPKGKCMYTKKLMKQSWSFSVDSTYRKKGEHNNPYVELSNDSFLILTADRSGLFESLVKGDYLSKEKGSVLVKLTRDTEVFEYTLDFDCED
ncbi:MAG: hypothetical protein ACJA0U_003611 [Salibacteraceae bacterium]|jgi:hypothetical protein